MYNNHRSNKPRRIRSWIVFLGILVPLFTSALISRQAAAQIDEINWSIPVNISKSEDKVSTDPFLLADPSGVVHLFWAEKVSDDPGLLPDTIMYSVWDGETWSKPVDIAFSPLSDGTPIATYPQAVLDERGWIHLAWLSEPNFPYYALNYTSVPAWLASYPQAWQEKTVLASNLTGTKYSFDIDYNSTQGLQIVYATGATGENLRQEKAVTYIRSMDYGATWSEPTDLYTFTNLERGASDTRLLLVEPSKVFVTWTAWDKTGNGQAVYFTRSLDNGDTWDTPKTLTERVGDEYERDWNNLASLGGDSLVTFWEGGYRAYHYASVSHDNGATWSEPIDAFPFLIGEAGFAEFVNDSTGALHVFLSKRIREGNFERGELGGMWHSVWDEQGQRWREPTLATLMGGAENMTNPKVAIVNGNRIVAAWYGSHIDEIMLQTGVIQNAPETPSIPWKMDVPAAELAPTTPAVEEAPEQAETADPLPVVQPADTPQQISPSQYLFIILGVIPALFVVLIFVFLKLIRSRII